MVAGDNRMGEARRRAACSVGGLTVSRVQRAFMWATIRFGLLGVRSCDVGHNLPLSIVLAVLFSLQAAHWR